MSLPRISRRAAMAGAGMAVAGGAFAAGSARASIGTDAPVADAFANTVILQDARHVLPAAMRRQLVTSEARVIELAADPVRQWRGESAVLLAARSTRLLGITSWPQFLMVRGLAEESGRRVRYQRLDAASGAIIWLIA